MKIRLVLLVLIMISSSSGMVFAQNAAEAETARHLEPEKGKALVYFIRPSNLGFSVEMDIFSNNEYIGTTRGKNFLYCYLEPGETEFRARGENTSILNLSLEADSTYYIHQKIHMGTIKARSELVTFENELKARQKLTRCKLSKTQNTALH